MFSWSASRVAIVLVTVCYVSYLEGTSCWMHTDTPGWQADQMQSLTDRRLKSRSDQASY